MTRSHLDTEITLMVSVSRSRYLMRTSCCVSRALFGYFCYKCDDRWYEYSTWGWCSAL